MTITRKGWHFLERLTNGVYITTETVYISLFGELFWFTPNLIQFTVSFFTIPRKFGNSWIQGEHIGSHPTVDVSNVHSLYNCLAK